MNPLKILGDLLLPFVLSLILSIIFSVPNIHSPRTSDPYQCYTFCIGPFLKFLGIFFPVFSLSVFVRALLMDDDQEKKGVQLVATLLAFPAIVSIVIFIYSSIF